MAKKPKTDELTEMQIFYLNANRNKDFDELAKITGVSKERIVAHFDSQDIKKNIKAVYKSGKGDRGVRVLTPAESENAEMDMSKYRGQGLKNKFKPDIFVPNKD